MDKRLAELFRRQGVLVESGNGVLREFKASGGAPEKQLKYQWAQVLFSIDEIIDEELFTIPARTLYRFK